MMLRDMQHKCNLCHAEKKTITLRSLMEKEEMESLPTGKNRHRGIAHVKTFKSRICTDLCVCGCAKLRVCVIICEWAGA